MLRCEALVLLRASTPRTMSSRWEITDRYVPCGALPAHLHHKLTRARGGLILDNAGETYHQMWLCPKHHDIAHDTDTAFDAGLLIRGLVTTGPTGKPVYQGPDEYLSEKYGSKVHTP